MDTILRNRIEDLVYEAGMSPHLKGFKYACDIIEIFYKTRYTTDNVKCCYEDLVEKENKLGREITVKQVERNIRHAIASTFTNMYMGVELRKKIFKDPFRESCSNTVFIHSVVMYMIHQDRIEERNNVSISNKK